ncbi:MAG: NAD(P)/FAD-dependent oxidoreductase [Peptococcaceae bacterium]|nr:NAD(P)/FAD-dependent oxidoreductase [Peptococcaceae bacterium]
MKKIFEPITINKMEIKNRFVVSAMETHYCNSDGCATERFIAYHEEKAKGGWGLIIPENYTIREGVGIDPNLPGLYSDSQILSHTKLVENVHKYGAKIACQLYHAGKRVANSIVGQEPVGPSAIKFAGDPNSKIPRELTVSEIKEIENDFASCAYRAKKAGFDAVEIHGAHGYLIHSFLSPFSNKRMDEYGGSIYGRSRFAIEVIQCVRQAVGTDFPILFRMSAYEGNSYGISIEEAKAIAILLEKAGVDCIHVSQGGEYNQVVSPSSYEAKATYVNNACEIKKVVDIPVIAAGRITEPILAEEIISSGKADLVTMARASLADPELPNKAARGAFQEINYCIGCLQGCTFGCLVNPRTGHETEYDLSPALDTKRVYIAGGGIAGCEAAIIAAKKGHQVTLFESHSTLGGQWQLACVPPGKTDFSSFGSWQKYQLSQLGVDVLLNQTLTKDRVFSDSPDVVILATGGKPSVPDIDGIKDNIFVTQANDILSGTATPGKNVVIIGGGSVGAETAHFCNELGSNVTILEIGDQIAKDVSPRVKPKLLEALQKQGTKLYVNTQTLKIDKNNIFILRDNMYEVISNIDTIILAVGSKPYNSLERELKNFKGKIISVGDCKKVKSGHDNILEAFITGLSI